MFQGGNQIKTYRIALGASPVGAKREEGDMKTPEGIYKIDGRNPQSSFHRALHVSYPSDEDDKRAAARGVSAGFDIMIHGIQNGRAWIGAVAIKLHAIATMMLNSFILVFIWLFVFVCSNEKFSGCFSQRHGHF